MREIADFKNITFLYMWVPQWVTSDIADRRS